jgi:predicted aminopeptidase
VNDFEDNVNALKLTEEYKEAIEIFPALHKYKTEHTIANLQKLCVEVADFCKAIYASTQSDEERKVYKTMLEKLNK